MQSLTFCSKSTLVCIHRTPFHLFSFTYCNLNGLYNTPIKITDWLHIFLVLCNFTWSDSTYCRAFHLLIHSASHLQSSVRIPNQSYRQPVPSCIGQKVTKHWSRVCHRSNTFTDKRRQSHPRLIYPELNFWREQDYGTLVGHQKIRQKSTTRGSGPRWSCLVAKFFTLSSLTRAGVIAPLSIDLFSSWAPTVIIKVDIFFQSLSLQILFSQSRVCVGCPLVRTELH